MSPIFDEEPFDDVVEGKVLKVYNNSEQDKSSRLESYGRTLESAGKVKEAEDVYVKALKLWMGTQARP